MAAQPPQRAGGDGVILGPRMLARIGALVVLVLAAAGCSASAESEADESPVWQSPNEVLLAAAFAGDVGAARAAIEKGGDVNAKDNTQQSAFLISTSEVGDSTDLLDLTLAHGADINAKDSYNGTGLIRAADRGFVTICERLIEAGVDIDHVNNLGWTALLEAVILGGGDRAHQQVVALLLEKGADRSIKDPRGRTALEIAQQSGYDEIAALLAG
jgi:uncharacterized protein